MCAHARLSRLAGNLLRCAISHKSRKSGSTASAAGGPVRSPQGCCRLSSVQILRTVRLVSRRGDGPSEAGRLSLGLRLGSTSSYSTEYPRKICDLSCRPKANKSGHRRSAAQIVCASVSLRRSLRRGFVGEMAEGAFRVPLTGRNPGVRSGRKPDFMNEEGVPFGRDAAAASTVRRARPPALRQAAR